jgi:hypothetical protein
MKKIAFLIVVALIAMSCEKQDQDLNNLTVENQTLVETGVKAEVEFIGDAEPVQIMPAKTEETKSSEVNQ